MLQLILMCFFSSFLYARSVLMLFKPTVSNSKSLKVLPYLYMIHSNILLPHENVDYPYAIGLRVPVVYHLAFYFHLLFSQKFWCFFVYSIFTSTSLRSFVNLLMVISHENLSILWLVTNDAEFTVLINLFFSLKHFLKIRFDDINGYDVIQIIFHVNNVFRFLQYFFFLS